MGYNPLDVTTVKANTITGPLWWRETPYTGDLTASFDPEALGYVQIGEAATGGIDTAQSSTKTNKVVWGAKTVGATYTEFTDTVLVRFASLTDADLLGVLFGDGNVTVTGGEVLVKVKNRQPSRGSLFIDGVTDSGEKAQLLVGDASPDLNLTRTWSDEAITTAETTFDCYEQADGTTHQERYGVSGS